MSDIGRKDRVTQHLVVALFHVSWASVVSGPGRPGEQQ